MNQSRRNLVKLGIYSSFVPVLFRPVASLANLDTNFPSVLSRSERKTVTAITGRIIPADGTPGAVDAHCVDFVEIMLASDSEALSLYKAALTEISRICLSRYQQGFRELSHSLQDTFISDMQHKAITEWEHGDASPDRFFDAVWAHTIMGFLSDPKYGGNHQYIGWQTAGFPGHMHQLGGVSAGQMRGKERVQAVWGEEI